VRVRRTFAHVRRALIAGVAVAASCVDPNRPEQPLDSPAWVAQREQMVAQQLRGRDITDERVLAAMAAVPRHAFVPPDLRAQAYADQALPIARGQTISQPYVVALMSQLLDLHGTERVLEVGTGSGYQTAVLARLAGAVYSIEIDPELAERARNALAGLGYSTVHVRAGDGYYGWPDAAPFDAVIVTAAMPRAPDVLLGQLRDGGRIVAPLERGDGEELAVGIKHGDRLDWTAHGGVRFVPMTGEVRKTPA
jgi:protein-L-isoaspartate(D-aspartate) O-methyltransferase